MTISELLVLNSVLPADSGFTVLDHLTNISITREVYCGVDVSITEDMRIDVTSAIITGNVQPNVIIASVGDDTVTAVRKNNMEVSLGC